MTGDPGPSPHAAAERGSEERWLAAVRTELRRVQAPEGLRARIGAMLAVEQRFGS
jgi:hypothetical protein